MLSLVNTFVQFKSLCRINLFILSIVQNWMIKLEQSFSDRGMPDKRNLNTALTVGAQTDVSRVFLFWYSFQKLIPCVLRELGFKICTF